MRVWLELPEVELKLLRSLLVVRQVNEKRPEVVKAMEVASRQLEVQLYPDSLRVA